MTISATYSPDDNKIRLTASSRLDRPTYDRVKAAGFHWAPKLEQFIAPMWTPYRESLALELSEQESLDDEDGSLMDRAEVRAERFGDYSERRTADAERASTAAHDLAAAIPFGQPILVGHHSERRARKDAERIQSGMAKASKAWSTAAYWEQRAEAAIRHARYKERVDVRHRRIKGIEADRRKNAKERAETIENLTKWTVIAAANTATPETPAVREMAMNLADDTWRHRVMLPRELNRSQHGRDSIAEALRWTENPVTVAQCCAWAAEALEKWHHPRHETNRWAEHYDNRLAYERAMMAASTGAESLDAAWPDLAVGCRIQAGDRSTWFVVAKVNRGAEAAISSVNILPSKRKMPVEAITACMPAEAGVAEAAKAATKRPPLVNYRGDGFAEMTADEYRRKVRHQYARTETIAATESHGAHRQRSAIVTNWRMASVFLTDEKVKERPAPVLKAAGSDVVQPIRSGATPPATRAREPSTLQQKADHAAQVAKVGVQVIAAPQLFPTPPALAEQMARALDVERGMTVLEPSAGTGRLIHALRATYAGAYALTAVEVHAQLAERLRITDQVDDTHRADFLAWTGGPFDRIVMNPPFSGGADIAHILHAIDLLKPGGRLVALCADGPRQQKALGELGVYEPLPEGSFTTEGTAVRVAMLTVDKPAVAAQSA